MSWDSHTNGMDHTQQGAQLLRASGIPSVQVGPSASTFSGRRTQGMRGTGAPLVGKRLVWGRLVSQWQAGGHIRMGDVQRDLA